MWLTSSYPPLSPWGVCVASNNLQKLADPASKDVIIDTPLLTEWLGSHIENCFGGQAGATIVRCTVASPSFTIEVKGPDVK